VKWVLIFIMFGGGPSGSGHPPAITTQRFESLGGCQEAARIVTDAIRINADERGSRPYFAARCVLDSKEG
jgi:hypothetical protein